MAILALATMSRALRLCGVLDASESIESQAATDAMDVLNRTGQRWVANGLIDAWQDATAFTDPLTLPDSANEAFVYTLALKLAPEYGLEVPKSVESLAQTEQRLLWRDRLASAVGNTAKAIIFRALRIVSGSGVQVLPDSVYLPTHLQTLNGMLAEWYAAEIGLPQFSFANIDTALGTDAGDCDAIAGQFAIRVAPEYGAQIQPGTMMMLAESFNRMKLRYFQPGRVDLSELPYKLGTYNITTDC